MRLIVTGGGTGGHVYPALAVADKFVEMNPETQVLYIGNEEGIEREIVPKKGYNLELVNARWLDKSSPKELMLTGVSVIKGIGETLKIMRQFKPDVVIGTGGFVCFPVVIAGKIYGAKTFIHEQNAFPGVANRKLEPFVKKIFLGFDGAEKFFKNKKKLVYAGNPVRKSFFKMDRESSREKLNIPKEDFMVMSFGGSLGAEKINDLAFEILKEFNGKPGTRLIFGTGKWYIDGVQKKIENEKIKLHDNVKVLDYISDMDYYLSASDLIISRAGALSVAETTICGRASILIPSPNVTGNHQYYNAKVVADKGGAILVEEKDLNSRDILDKIIYLKDNPEKLRKMEEKSYEAGPHNALDIIYESIMNEIKG